jgi:hypothetical protein
MCCGQKRATMANRTLYRPNPALTAETPGANNTLRMRYLQQPRVIVRGQASGKLYEFSGAEPDVAVDQRDAAALEQTGFFRRL